VAGRAVAALHERHQNLDVVVVAAGQLTAQREAEVLEELWRAQPDLVLVGMGAGVQERWIAAARRRVPSATWWAVGALFDYVAGVERRAPQWMSTAGLEWAFRLLQDPRGKWRRYVLGNPTFVARVLRERLRKGA
jgi:N-acetylglucosaminyldiphosphoundecaprenol N-acetyl-beta-D-mannosaminyltransferase